MSRRTVTMLVCDRCGNEGPIAEAEDAYTINAVDAYRADVDAFETEEICAQCFAEFSDWMRKKDQRKLFCKIVYPNGREIVVSSGYEHWTEWAADKLMDYMREPERRNDDAPPLTEKGGPNEDIRGNRPR